MCIQFAFHSEELLEPAIQASLKMFSPACLLQVARAVGPYIHEE